MEGRRLIYPNAPLEALIISILYMQGFALFLPSPVRENNKGIIIFNILEELEQVF